MEWWSDVGTRRLREPTGTGWSPSSQTSTALPPPPHRAEPPSPTVPAALCSHHGLCGDESAASSMATSPPRFRKRAWLLLRICWRAASPWSSPASMAPPAIPIVPAATPRLALRHASPATSKGRRERV
ncbi:hypothetical protein DAI22_11g066433 [Oryza sativa Japonica Group]|nr:hypothetical protein DAI22_11g066433 [Oryza sativa Japonica Group]